MRCEKRCLWILIALLFLTASGALREARGGMYGRRHGRGRSPDPRTTWRPAKIYRRNPASRQRRAGVIYPSSYSGSIRHPAEMRQVRRDQVAMAAAAPAAAVAAAPAPKKKAPPPPEKKPEGGVVKSLPQGAVKTEVQGRPFYRAGDRWYRRVYYAGRFGYLPVEAPEGLWVPALPLNYEVRFAGKDAYYLKDGVYYREGKSPEGKHGYLVAKAPSAASATPPAAGEKPVTPDPFQILKAMSDTLGGAERFSFASTDTFDDVLESGQKVQKTVYRRFRVARPDRVQVEAKGDIGARKVFYNGKTLTLFDQGEKAYSELAVPERIDGMLDFIAEKHALTLPVADLAYSSVYDAVAPVTKGGRYLGRHKVGEIECHHLAFEGDVADWQIWIDAGETPLPRKMVITYKKIPHHPEYEAMLKSWNLNPNLSPELFEFSPPAGVEKIDALPVIEDKSA